MIKIVGIKTDVLLNGFHDKISNGDSNDLNKLLFLVFAIENIHKNLVIYSHQIIDCEQYLIIVYHIIIINKK